MSLEKEKKYTQKDKPGESYEELVEVLSRYLHEHAIITRNDRIIDIHTGRKRQIDISVRLTDGPMDFLAIIEARDRSRKVGVDYVEQVKSKRDSVTANKAVIVSKRGFTKTAIQKAEHYGIELYSLVEALRRDWSRTFTYFQRFTQWSYGGSYEIFFLDKDRKVVNPHKTLNDMIKKDKNALVLYDKDGKPKYGLNILLQQVYNLKEIESLVNSDIHKEHDFKAFIPVPKEADIYFLNEEGVLRQLELYGVVGKIKRVIKEYEPTVKQYKDEKSGKIIAEVIGADDPSFMFELLHNRETGDVSIRKK